MKIAIPTDDGITMSAHFGRCRDFLIFETRNGQVQLIETRPNGGCHEHGSGKTDGVAGHHSHSGFVDTLRGCEAVVCGGIGAGAIAALESGGISVFRTQATGSAEQVASALQSGGLPPAAGGVCQCRH